MTCLVCDAPPVYARGRCLSCYRYLRRHKHDRTEKELDALAAAAYKKWQREQEREICRLGALTP